MGPNLEPQTSPPPPIGASLFPAPRRPAMPTIPHPEPIPLATAPPPSPSPPQIPPHPHTRKLAARCASALTRAGTPPQREAKSSRQAATAEPVPSGSTPPSESPPQSPPAPPREDRAESRRTHLPPLASLTSARE